MNKKVVDVYLIGTPEHKTQESLEGLKNPEVRNLNKEEGQPAPDLADEIKGLVEGIASGTSPTISDDHTETICRAVVKYVGRSARTSNTYGFCWLAINKELSVALQNAGPDQPTNAAVWAILVLYQDGAESRIDVSGLFQLQLGLDGVGIHIVVSEAVIQNWPTTTPAQDENALEILASRAQADHCDADAYVMLNIDNGQCTITGCLTAEGVDAYRAGELKILRASMVDSALLEIPLSLERRPQRENGGLVPSGSEEQRIEPGQGLFKRVGDVIEGPDVRKNFQPRETTKEYIRDATAELGFAKVYNLVWNGNPFRGCGPAEEDIYIISIGPNDAHELVIDARHSDRDILVLALVDEATVYLIGWLYASEAARPEWLVSSRNGEPRYRVPENSLRNISQLQVSDQQLEMLVMAKRGPQA